MRREKKKNILNWITIGKNNWIIKEEEEKEKRKEKKIWRK